MHKRVFGLGEHEQTLLPIHKEGEQHSTGDVVSHAARVFFTVQKHPVLWMVPRGDMLSAST